MQKWAIVGSLLPAQNNKLKNILYNTHLDKEANIKCHSIKLTAVHVIH